jgi:hypothetical protein
MMKIGVLFISFPDLDKSWVLTYETNLGSGGNNHNSFSIYKLFNRL